MANISDNIILHGKNSEEHGKRLQQLLEKLKEKNAEKCKFYMTEMVFMGLVLTDKSIGLKPSLMQESHRMPRLRKVYALNLEMSRGRHSLSLREGCQVPKILGYFDNNAKTLIIASPIGLGAVLIMKSNKE